MIDILKTNINTQKEFIQLQRRKEKKKRWETWIRAATKQFSISFSVSLTLSMVVYGKWPSKTAYNPNSLGFPLKQW